MLHLSILHISKDLSILYILKIKVSGILEYAEIKIADVSLPLSVLAVFVKMTHKLVCFDRIIHPHA